jgi:hypothetical protein
MSTHAVSTEHRLETTTPMTTTNHASISNKQLWASRVLSGLAALFLLVDGGMKSSNPLCC